MMPPEREKLSFQGRARAELRVRPVRPSTPSPQGKGWHEGDRPYPTWPQVGLGTGRLGRRERWIDVADLTVPPDRLLDLPHHLIGRQAQIDWLNVRLADL